MSEHLADLNEKLTSQAEFIEQLKYEIKVSVNELVFNLYKVP